MDVDNLDPAARRELEALARSDEGRIGVRARAVLLVHCGTPVRDAASAVGVSRQAVYHWLQWVRREQGPMRQRLGGASRRGRPRIKSETIDRMLHQLVASDQWIAGDGAAGGWTVRRLQEALRRRFRLEAGRDTIRRSLARAGFRWDGTCYVCSASPHATPAMAPAPSSAARSSHGTPTSSSPSNSSPGGVSLPRSQ